MKNDINKLKRLAGIPLDLSKVENAKTTIKSNKHIFEASKVPSHRGELAVKSKENMRARTNHAKKALEALELARDELMDLPAIDYMEDIPTIVKQLHKILHGEDGTGGLHHHHRQYKHEFDSTVFPEDIEEDKLKDEEERLAQEAGITGDEPESGKKKKTNETFDVAAVKKHASNPAPSQEGKSDGLGFEKQKVDPSEENKKPFKLAPDSLPNEDTMVVNKEQAKEVGEDPADNTETDDKVLEAKKVKEKKGKTEEDEADEEDCAMSSPVAEASGPLFARDSQHPKHSGEEKYNSWTGSNKPVNVISDNEPSLYYPNGSKSENANQLSTNPYNENQKVNVPAKLKSSLKEEADKARKLAETFTMRKDWDSKNFHETLANAMDTLNQFLDKGTVYGIKEAQVFMTSLMSPFQNKLPSDVIKFVASGGSLRSLKSYVNDVREPVTGKVFQQDSNGLK